MQVYSLLLCCLQVAVLLAQEQLCTWTNPLGCYTDNSNRALRYELASSDNSMTQDKCAQLCYDAGYQLAGVEDGIQCFCDNAINPVSTKAADSDCQTPCAGDSSKACGGIWRIYIGHITCVPAIPSYQECLTEPSKSLPFCNPALTIEKRVEDLMSRLTVAEKIYAITPHPELGSTCESHTGGMSSVGVGPYAWLVETNTGVASRCRADGLCATTFSGPLGMAASFNRTSWKLKGSVFGSEMRANANSHGVRASGMLIGLTGYGPNINIARDPRFGRNSELPGEDPFLSGTYAANMVLGMQELDHNGHPKMIALLKHFDAYSVETNRGHDNYNISMHDLWDTYLAQYRIAFTTFPSNPPSGVMCSYNGVNGQPSCANSYLLNKALRSWVPDALVTTDCGAVSNLLGAPVNAPDGITAAAYAINNGTDVEMGSTVMTDNLLAAVNKGLVSEAAINATFRRAFLPLFRAGRFDPIESIAWTNLNHTDINSPAHKQIQYEAALQSLVLLKNTDNILPLSPAQQRIAVIGPQASAKYGLLSDYFGDEVCVGGTYDCIPTIADHIAALNGHAYTVVAKGVDVNSDDVSGVQEALDLVGFSDVVVLVLGIDKTVEYEGVDRTDTALPGMQQPFAEMVLAQGKPVVLILTNGGALAIDTLVGANAIIEAFNPSLAGAQAIAETLFGLQNRWGKLPITMYPHSYIAEQPMANFDMSSGPGRTYRYYTGTPLFPFGHGLSYSNFTLSCGVSTPAPKLLYTCNVTNTATRDGEEVVLVYHKAGDDVRRQADHPVPIRSLIGFERVAVPAKKSVSVKFSFDFNALNLVNAQGQDVLYKGTHTLVFSRGHGDEVEMDVYVEDNGRFLRMNAPSAKKSTQEQALMPSL